MPARTCARSRSSWDTHRWRARRCTRTFREKLSSGPTSRPIHVPERTRRWRRRSALAVLSLLLAAGCALREGRTGPFTTSNRFPPGIIEGDVVATGFPAPGTFLWCYPDGRKPDSTARDFDAVGLAGEGGAFRVTGLAVPGRYRIWAF